MARRSNREGSSESHSGKKILSHTQRVGSEVKEVYELEKHRKTKFHAAQNLISGTLQQRESLSNRKPLNPDSTERRKKSNFDKSVEKLARFADKRVSQMIEENKGNANTNVITSRNLDPMQFHKRS